MGEPMIVPLHRKGRVIFDASQRPVAGLSGFGSEDDAEIFVLSVNACAGISKETLAAGPTLAEVIRMRKQEYDKLRVTLKERDARIRAEARAEALKEAKRKALAWWFDPNTPSTPEAMGAAILADEPKEERGAEVGDLVAWEYMGDWHIAILDEQRRQAFPTHGVTPIVVRRRAEVERRIEANRS